MNNPFHRTPERRFLEALIVTVGTLVIIVPLALLVGGVVLLAGGAVLWLLTWCLSPFMDPNIALLVVLGLIGFGSLVYSSYQQSKAMDEQLARAYENSYQRNLASLQGDEDGEEQQAEEGDSQAREQVQVRGLPQEPQQGTREA